jgi:predicted nucleic-acid-binding protein
VIALDTNVVVRVLAADDEQQLKAALSVLHSGPLWLAKTVLLETEWVLRYSYGLEREAIHHAVFRLLGLQSLTVEGESAVLRALGWYRQGLDFADALHLASSSAAERFVTFDRRLARTANKVRASPEVDLVTG